MSLFFPTPPNVVSGANKRPHTVAGQRGNADLQVRVIHARAFV